MRTSISMDSKSGRAFRSASTAFSQSAMRPAQSCTSPRQARARRQAGEPHRHQRQSRSAPKRKASSRSDRVSRAVLLFTFFLSGGGCVTPSPSKGEGRGGGRVRKASPPSLDPPLALPLQGGGSLSSTPSSDRQLKLPATFSHEGRRTHPASCRASKDAGQPARTKRPRANPLAGQSPRGVNGLLGLSREGGVARREAQTLWHPRILKSRGGRLSARHMRSSFRRRAPLRSRTESGLYTPAPDRGS